MPEAQPSDSKSFLLQIVRPTSAMAPDRQLIHLYTEINRILALASGEVQSLRNRITQLEKKE